MTQLGDLTGQERPDGLDRRRERRIVGVHQNLGHDARHRLGSAQAPQLVAQRLLDHVSDLALRLRAADVQRYARHQPRRRLVLDQ